MPHLSWIQWIAGFGTKIEDTSTQFEQIEDDIYNFEDTWNTANLQCEVGHEAWKSSAAHLEQQKAKKGEIPLEYKAQNGKIIHRIYEGVTIAAVK